MSSEGPAPSVKNLLTGFNPLKFLSDFWKKYPAAGKVIYAGLALFSAAAIILALKKNFVSLTFTALTVLALGLLVVLIVEGMREKSTRRFGIYVIYAIMGLFGAYLAFLISAVSFGWPADGANLIARLLSSTEVLSDPNSSSKPWIITTKTSIRSLPHQMLLPPKATANIERALEIRQLPELVVQGGSITLTGPNDHRVISASKLILSDGGIETNGGTLTIYADTIETSGGYIQAFAPDAAAPAGSNGRDAGTIKLNVVRDIRGFLTVSLDGEAGGSGRVGVEGRKGSVGENGDESHFRMTVRHGGCDNADDGKRGGNGQDGSSGGAGGRAGAGGQLIIVSTFASRLSSSITFSSKAGLAGEGGAGGAGGEGGKGGTGGKGHRPCHAGSDGAMGDAGNQGEQGPSGGQSRDGPSIILKKPE